MKTILLIIIALVLSAFQGQIAQTGTVTGGGMPVGPGMRIATHCLGHDIVSTYNDDTGHYRLDLPGRVCVTQAWSVRGEYTSGPRWFVARGDVQMDLNLWRVAW